MFIHKKSVRAVSIYTVGSFSSRGSRIELVFVLVSLHGIRLLKNLSNAMIIVYARNEDSYADARMYMKRVKQD